MELSLAGGGLIHIGVCSFLYFCIKKEKIRVSLHMFPLVFFIPFWGALCVVATDVLNRHTRQGKTAKHALVNTLTPSALASSLAPSSVPTRFVEKESSSADIVPLEEAMLVNDPSTRRALIMEVLQGSSAQDLSMLKKVGFMGDTEVMHYAATIMVEAQEKLEADLLQAKKLYQTDPENIDGTKRYAQSLQKLIASGLLEGTILRNRRKQYGELMDRLIAHSPNDLELFIQWADNQIDLCASQTTRRAVKNALERWGADERLLMQLIQLNAALGYIQDIQDTVKNAEKDLVILSPKAQETMEFWSYTA